MSAMNNPVQRGLSVVLDIQRDKRPAGILSCLSRNEQGLIDRRFGITSGKTFSLTQCDSQTLRTALSKLGKAFYDF